MDAFICPITYEKMRDPVMAMDGHTYERAAIERWISESTTISVLSPLTGTLMGRLLIPNYALKKAIDRLIYLNTKNCYMITQDYSEPAHATLK